MASPCKRLFHRFHHVVRCQHRVCEKREVDERCRVTVAPLGMARGGSRILYNGNFETLLEQITQVRFDTHVRQHTAENDFAHAAHPAWFEGRGVVLKLNNRHEEG
jgi:hypothetical protein